MWIAQFLRTAVLGRDRLIEFERLSIHFSGAFNPGLRSTNVKSGWGSIDKAVRVRDLTPSGGAGCFTAAKASEAGPENLGIA
jgi:hypothetical protein